MIERKDDFMKKNYEYVAPELSFVAIQASDVITNSPGGFDDYDNWKSDVFAQ